MFPINRSVSTLVKTEPNQEMMAWIMVLYRVQEEETTILCVESQKNDTKKTLCRFRVLCRLPPEQASEQTCGGVVKRKTGANRMTIVLL